MANGSVGTTATRVSALLRERARSPIFRCAEHYSRESTPMARHRFVNSCVGLGASGRSPTSEGVANKHRLGGGNQRDWNPAGLRNNKPRIHDFRPFKPERGQFVTDAHWNEQDRADHGQQSDGVGAQEQRQRQDRQPAGHASEQTRIQRPRHRKADRDHEPQSRLKRQRVQTRDQQRHVPQRHDRPKQLVRSSERGGF